MRLFQNIDWYARYIKVYDATDTLQPDVALDLGPRKEHDILRFGLNDEFELVRHQHMLLLEDIKLSLSQVDDLAELQSLLWIVNILLLFSECDYLLLEVDLDELHIDVLLDVGGELLLLGLSLDQLTLYDVVLLTQCL